MTAFVRDLRFAVRGLLRSPSFYASSVAILAIAIGANTALFALIHGLLWTPLPFPHSGRIVIANAVSWHDTTPWRSHLLKTAMPPQDATRVIRSAVSAVDPPVQKPNARSFSAIVHANSWSTVKLVMLDTLRPVAIGLAVAILPAVWPARWIASLLYGVGPADPLSAIAAIAGIGVTALLASAVPAWRATRTSIAEALKSE